MRDGRRDGKHGWHIGESCCTVRRGEDLRPASLCRRVVEEHGQKQREEQWALSSPRVSLEQMGLPFHAVSRCGRINSSRVEGRATPQRAAVIETNAARQSIAGQGMAEHRPHEDWAVLGGSSLVWAASDVGTTAVRAVTAVAAVACDA